MICGNVQKYFCCEDISLIENYDKAVSSPEKWDCHHRLETDLDLTKQELIDTNRYYNVEAKYLIFLTHSEHMSLHQKLRNNFGVRTVTKHSAETKMKMSISARLRKPRPKNKYLTTTGEIKEMSKWNVTKWHPDWKLIELL